MNNLNFLRKECNLSLRKLGKMVNISFTTLGKLESEERHFRQIHIEGLINFFKCSSDFLLGKTDYGIFVELDSDFAAIYKEDYINYKREKCLVEYIQFNSVWRIPNDELKEKLSPTSNKQIKEQIIEHLNTLSKSELEKVLKLIKLLL